MPFLVEPPLPLSFAVLSLLFVCLFSFVLFFVCFEFALFLLALFWCVLFGGVGVIFVVAVVSFCCLSRPEMLHVFVFLISSKLQFLFWIEFFSVCLCSLVWFGLFA